MVGTNEKEGLEGMFFFPFSLSICQQLETENLSTVAMAAMDMPIDMDWESEPAGDAIADALLRAMFKCRMARSTATPS